MIFLLPVDCDISPFLIGILSHFKVLAIARALKFEILTISNTGSRRTIFIVF